MRFSGSFEELEVVLNRIAKVEKAVQTSTLQCEFLLDGGRKVCWARDTGEIAIKGPFGPKQKLKNKLRQQLKNIEPTVTSPVQPENVAYRRPAHDERSILGFSPKSNAYVPDEDSELIIGLVGAVGTDLDVVTRILVEKLQIFEYETTEIRISKDIISKLGRVTATDNYNRIDELMSEGNRLRRDSGDYAILAKAAAAKVNEIRFRASSGHNPEPMKRRAFVISSLKHPDEVQALRKIYSNGFFLIGVYSSESRRREYLNRDKDITPENVDRLVVRDVDESEKFGQHTRDTYHLSDFFINYDGNADRFKRDIWRTLDLIFGKPYVTPTFDEFAMFMAFSASLRSADLSRQVGAVVTKNNAIVATGANDVPKFEGGLYWPDYRDADEISDVPGGRDYTLGNDRNVVERNDIIEDIVSKVPSQQRDAFREILLKSKLKNITEYGRVVHAEMEALLSCARESVSTKNATLYCTTFPCHNCAKHIIAAGVTRVVYVEPYPKSKALDFHGDSISLDSINKGERLIFEPFVGVGPRSFFNLFSTNLGAGYPVKRKNDDGTVVAWDQHNSKLRMQMLPTSYIERETSAAVEVDGYRGRN